MAYGNLNDLGEMMTEYNAFDRGQRPVGTRSYEWTDASRERTLPVDVWYPATAQYASQDLDEATQDNYETVPGMPSSSQQAVRDADSESGNYPLVVFSHGFGGEKRQSTFLYTHLASHGYVVAAMDHIGNTIGDMISGASEPNNSAQLTQFMSDRPTDCSFVIDLMLAGNAGVSIDAGRIGISGHSFGGWTSLMASGSDARIKAALPLAPAGGISDEDDGAIEMANALDLGWNRSVPVLMLVADLDSILPLSGMQDLHGKIVGPHRTVVLNNADHFHFCDNVEQAHDGFKMMMPMMDPEASAMLHKMKAAEELCPGDQANAFVRGLGLGHFDAHLCGNTEAMKMLDGDLEELMASQGVAVTVMD